MAELIVFVENKIREFLLEDLGFGDITTDSIIDESVKSRAYITCNEEAVIAGMEEAAKVFTVLGCEVDPLERDGSLVKKKTPVLQIIGSSRAILKGERTALNILSRMSGIATATQRALMIAKRGNPKIRVACTRKTAPGLRYFDKRAVELGGGDTHRLRLDDCVLIKDNHLIMKSVKEAIKMIKERVSFTKKIEVEVENLEQAIEAVEAEANIVMLDNMNPKEITSVLKELEKKGLRKRVLIEASGGIDLDNIIKYAKTGVDIISMGSLTHSVNAIDLSLEIIKEV